MRVAHLGSRAKKRHLAVLFELEARMSPEVHSRGRENLSKYSFSVSEVRGFGVDIRFVGALPTLYGCGNIKDYERTQWQQFQGNENI